MRFYTELKRRGVLRVGSAYVVGAWLLAQVAEFLTETFDAPLWVLRSSVVVLSVALVPVLVLSWMFEFTPAGIQRQAELDRSGVVLSRAGRRLDYLIAVLLLLAAGWLAFSWSEQIRTADQAAAVTALAQQQAEIERQAKAAEAAAPANSIAVLPFLNLSTAADSSVLADGLAEELLGMLGRNRGLRVTARSSAFRFRDQNRDLREIGKLLGVRYVLEGSVRLAASRARIGTQLIDASTGTLMWSGTYDRTLDDLFALQDEIAGEVARALNVVLLAGDGAANHGTLSTEAHLALMRGLQFAASRRVVDLDQAITELQRAIALDPGYAAAYVELAYAITTRAMQLAEGIVVPRPLLAPLLDKAIALDPQNGPARVLRGWLLEDPLAQEQAVREGLALAPSHARGYEMLAGLVSRDPARTDEALQLIDHAIALDPLSPRNHQVKGQLSHSMDDFTVSDAHFQRALELEPNFRMALVHLAATHQVRGDFAAAVHYGERAVAVDSSRWTRGELVRQLLNIGDVEAARHANQPAEFHLTLLILLYEDDIEGAMSLIRAAPADALSDEGLLVIIAALRDAHVNGNWKPNLELVRKLLDYEGELPAHDIGFGFDHAQLAYLMRGSGALVEAERLEAQLLAYLETTEREAPRWAQGPRNWMRAMLHAPAGRTEAALDALEIAFNPARPYWYCLLDRSPMFDDLREEPRYRVLRARLEEHLVGQRALLMELRRKQAAGDEKVPANAEAF